MHSEEPGDQRPDVTRGLQPPAHGPQGVAALRAFFEALGPARCRRIRLVSCDAAEWTADEARANSPGVIVCIDPFHVAQWASDALDVVRRSTWNDARKKGMTAEARQLKGSRGDQRSVRTRPAPSHPGDG